MVLGEGRGLHPNIQSRKNKNAWERIWCYVQKDGQAWGDDLPLPLTFRSFSRYKQDKDAWLTEAKVRNPKNPFPIALPAMEDREFIKEPKAYTREFIYIVHGPPNVGKSYWRKLNLTCGYFQVSDPKYPMEGYGGQQVILYDDFPFSELKSPEQLILKNGEWEPEMVSVGNTRYFKVYYPAKQQRIVIIITNTIYPFMRDARIKTRLAGGGCFITWKPDGQIFEWKSIEESVVDEVPAL